jgi:hypothetical protein
MRLTLRTLLAYLDDVLDPADARELAKKVKESEVASGLVHRIRNVTRKLRLGAPKLSGKGMGLDANTVAEYLDSTLAQDQIPDFERICIESDVHLAEVASCHQILTLVLGEPADVPPELRERIRAIDSTAAAPGPNDTESFQLSEAQPAPITQPAAPPLPEPPRSSEPAAGQPVAVNVNAVDRPPAALEPSIRVLPIAVTLLATFALALVALFVMGPMNSSHPIVGRFFADSDPLPEENAAAEPGEKTSEDTRDDAPNSNVVDPSRDVPSQALDMLRSDPANAVPDDGDGATTSTDDSIANQLPTDGTSDTIGDAPASRPEAMDAAAAGTGDAPRLPDEPPLTATPQPQPEDAGPNDSVMEVLTPPVADAEQPEEPADEAPPGIGRYTSDQHVLVHFDSESQAWYRMRTLGAVKSDELLVALPTYRPRLLVTPGIQLVLIGPTALRLHGQGAAGVPVMTVNYGRFLAVTDGTSGSDLELRIGQRRSRISFVDTDSTLALQLHPYLPPGSDPEQQEPHLLIRAFARDGALKWQDLEPSTAAVNIAAGQCADMIGAGPVEVHAEDSPDWLSAQTMSLIERDASKQLEPTLDLDRPVSVPLAEHVGDRLVEVRTLAIRCLAFFDDYDPFVDALNDAELRSYWKDLFLALQASLSRGPSSAEAVRETFQRLRGDEGLELYRLLWGYSPAQLSAEGGEQLIEYLEHPSMDIRVLAFENLRQITQKTHLYRPERDPKQQRRALVSWARALREGEIVYQDPPPEIPSP